jgi:hypothetical protein
MFNPLHLLMTIANKAVQDTKARIEYMFYTVKHATA